MVASRAIAVGSNGAGSDVDLDAAFQLAPIGLAILDRDLRYVRCNDALGQIDGFPPEDHFGRTLDELLPEIARNVGAALRGVFETGVPIRDIQVRGATPSSEDQDRVWLESVTPLPSTTERIEHILVSIKEITELERARVALRNSRAGGGWISNGTTPIPPRASWRGAANLWADACWMSRPGMRRIPN